MSDKKLLIILIFVILLQCVVTLTHPAYRYYRSQSENLRSDYLRFEKQVRDDFVPVLTNFLFSNNTGTKSVTNSSDSLSIISQKPSQTAYPMRHEKDDAAIAKPQQSLPNEIEATVGFIDNEYILYVNGHILRKGDILFSYPIQNIDPCSVDLGCVIISIKKPEVKEDEQKPLENIVVPYCPDVYGIGIL